MVTNITTIPTRGLQTFLLTLSITTRKGKQRNMIVVSRQSLQTVGRKRMAKQFTKNNLETTQRLPRLYSSG